MNFTITRPSTDALSPTLEFCGCELCGGNPNPQCETCGEFVTPAHSDAAPEATLVTSVEDLELTQ